MGKRGARKAVKKAAKSVGAKIKKADSKQPTVEVTIKSKVLGEAPKEYHFVLNSGKKLKSVYELIDSLEGMSEDLFSHHVTEMRNDFSSWLEEVFDEKNLADDIRSIRDKMETQRRLMKRLIDEVMK